MSTHQPVSAKRIEKPGTASVVSSSSGPRSTIDDQVSPLGLVCTQVIRGPGDGDVHDEDLISIISCTTVGWPLRPRDEGANQAPVNNVAASGIVPISPEAGRLAANEMKHCI
jgi:hypothetical protein